MLYFGYDPSTRITRKKKKWSKISTASTCLCWCFSEFCKQQRDRKTKNKARELKHGWIYKNSTLDTVHWKSEVAANQQHVIASEFFSVREDNSFMLIYLSNLRKAKNTASEDFLSHNQRTFDISSRYTISYKHRSSAIYLDHHIYHLVKA